LSRRRQLLLLTGAGCRTGSGIPDCRDADGRWKRAPPIPCQAFVGDAQVRRRHHASPALAVDRLLQERLQPPAIPEMIGQSKVSVGSRSCDKPGNGYHRHIFRRDRCRWASLPS
jgi:hypothetical protein